MTLHRSLRRGLALVLLLAVLTAATARPGYCWDKVAHMVIAQIAYDRLTPATKAKVDALAAQLNQDPFTLALDGKYKPYQFISIAAWPDDIKSLGQLTRSYGGWHYIDLDSLPTDDTAALAAVKAYPPGTTSNVYDAIETKCLPTLRDPNATPANQARMLAFLCHFVGDIHMPLHALGRDKGGNDYQIAAIDSDAGYHVANLHAYWDNGWRYADENGQITVNRLSDVPRPAMPDQGEIKRLADAIEAQNLPSDPKLLHQTDPAAWALESYRLATTIVYPVGGTHVLTPDYVKAARPVALQRIALAGYRLANMLNSLYDPSAATK